MLGKIRKFSNTVSAKIFLFIVAIPFVFWGMGDLFSGGNKNTIAKIGKDKISTQEFINFINRSNIEKAIDDDVVDNLLSTFIGEKLLFKEIDSYNIKISDTSLSKIIKNQDVFKKNNEFSRTQYEKFLVENSIDAVNFEKNILTQQQKKKLFNLIGGGLKPSNFLVDLEYNKINQKRDAQIINLDFYFKKKISINEEQIKIHYEKNIADFNKTYKTFKFIKLTPIDLTAVDEFGDLFFQKIDEIDDLIVEGNNIDFLSKKYNLIKLEKITFDELGLDLNSNTLNQIPKELAKKLFNNDDANQTILLEFDNNHFIFEFLEFKNIQKNINDKSVKKQISNLLINAEKRKLISELASKINNNVFKESNFNDFASKNNIEIKKVIFKNINDKKNYDENFVKQIYAYGEKKVVVVSDIGLSKNFLVFIDKIESVVPNKNSEDYTKYLNLAEINLVSSIYNTYDLLLKKKYEIDINYQALERVKNLVK